MAKKCVNCHILQKRLSSREAELQQARLAIRNTRATATRNKTLVTVAAQRGESVGVQAVIALADDILSVLSPNPLRSQKISNGQGGFMNTILKLIRPAKKPVLKARGRAFYKDLSEQAHRLTVASLSESPVNSSENAVHGREISVHEGQKHHTRALETVHDTSQLPSKTYTNGHTRGVSGTKSADKRDFMQQKVRSLVSYLKRRDIEADIPDARFSPQALIIEIELQDESKLSVLQKVDQLTLALRCPKGSVSVSIGKHGGLQIVLNLPAQMREDVYSAEIAGGGLGLDMDGDIVTLPLSINDNTVLVCGQQGSGKSFLMRTMIYQLVRSQSPDQIQVIIVDQRNNLAEYDNLAHLMYPRISDPDKLGAILETINNSALERTKQDAPIYIFIDEARELVTDYDFDASILGKLANKRQYGIYLIVGTQHVDEGSISDFARWSSVRYVGQVSNAQQSTFATGHSGANANRLGKRGDFLLALPSGVTRFQAALTTDEQIAMLPTGKPLLQASSFAKNKNEIDPVGRARGDYYIPGLIASELDYLEGNADRLSFAKARDRFSIGDPVIRDHRELARKIYGARGL